MTLEEFLGRPRMHKVGFSSWVSYPGLDVYLRRTFGNVEGVLHEDLLVIANCNAKKPGQGAFTRFLDDLETRVPEIYFESVLTERFSRWILQRGYAQVNHHYETANFYRRIT